MNLPNAEGLRKDSDAMSKRFEEHNGEPSAEFYEVLRKSLKKRKTTIDKICPPADGVARRACGAPHLGKEQDRGQSVPRAGRSYNRRP